MPYKIRNYPSDNLVHADDCIGNASTTNLCYNAIGDALGQYVALKHYPRLLTIRRRDVAVNLVLGWTLFEKEVKLAGASAGPVLQENLVFGRSG